MFDDYFSREEYKIVSQFFKVDERLGRLAVLNDIIKCNPDELEEAIGKYITDSY